MLGAQKIPRNCWWDDPPVDTLHIGFDAFALLLLLYDRLSTVFIPRYLEAKRGYGRAVGFRCEY